MAAESTPLIEVEDISKRFAHVQALSDVNFSARKDEIVGLVGDNGAGKSTLIKIMSGALLPDTGIIRVRGEETHIRNPRDARANGIATVYQDLALVDDRSVAHNIHLDDVPTKRFVVDVRGMRKTARDVLSSLHIDLPSVETIARLLSGGQRQAVAIGRAIRQGGELVIMDEPTAALGVEEQETVLRLIQDLHEGGHGVIVVSHNMAHIFSVATRIVVMRGGRIVGERLRADTSPEEIVRLIVGAELLEPSEQHVLHGESTRSDVDGG